MKIEKQCLHCGNIFQADKREHNRGNAKFCGIMCAAKFNAPLKRVHHEPNVECHFCKKPFYKRPSHFMYSKSGLFFCTRKCKDIAQKLEFNIKEIWPDHFNTSQGKRDYRFRALEHYGKKCQECGYDKNEKGLDVHHIDRNRKNNSITNLKVLCVLCHRLEHLDK